MAAMLLIGLLPSTAAAQATVAFTITDARIVASSSLARDVGGDLYWTANRRSQRGVVYGLTPSGAVRGTLNYRADPVNVEALAVANDTLYVGDIGDNSQRRSFVTIYTFDNPRATGLTVTYSAYDFRFPDGPRDAESLLVSGAGEILLVTKADGGGEIYAAPRSPSRQGVNRLNRVADAPAMVTDGVFLPGSEQIALRTDAAVYVLDASTYQTVATADVPPQARSTSLAVSLDGESLLLGSSGRNAKVYSIPVPKPPDTPPPSPTPSTTPEDEEADAGGGSTGTLLAIGLAAVVAIVAGVVVGLIHDR
jgi:hypothetical protein